MFKIGLLYLSDWNGSHKRKRKIEEKAISVMKIQKKSCFFLKLNQLTNAFAKA